MLPVEEGFYRLKPLYDLKQYSFLIRNGPLLQTSPLRNRTQSAYKVDGTVNQHLNIFLGRAGGGVGNGIMHKQGTCYHLQIIKYL